MKQGSNFLAVTFSNRDNARASTRFLGESQPQYLKRWFFLKNRPIHFHINSTSVKTGQMKPAEFFQHWNQQATSCPNPQCLVDQIQVQKSIIVVFTDWMPDHTYSGE